MTHAATFVVAREHVRLFHLINIQRGSWENSHSMLVDDVAAGISKYRTVMATAELQ